MFAKDTKDSAARNCKGSTNAFRVHGVISVVGVRPRSEATERNGDVSSDNIHNRILGSNEHHCHEKPSLLSPTTATPKQRKATVMTLAVSATVAKASTPGLPVFEVNMR